MNSGEQSKRDGGADISYKIGEVSRLTGVKAGTIRFYERCGFIGPVERASNNYRIYHRRQIFQLKVCRLVFGGFVNRRLRRASMRVLEASAGWDLEAYGRHSADYLRAVEEDIERTRKTIALCMGQMCREEEEAGYSRKQAAVIVGATPETIRGWERNGLLGRYEPYERRVYGQTQMQRMYVIRLLLDTGYSMMAIRSFLQAHDWGQPEKAEQLLISPGEDRELYCRADRYLEELTGLREKASRLCLLQSEMENI